MAGLELKLRGYGLTVRAQKNSKKFFLKKKISNASRALDSATAVIEARPTTILSITTISGIQG